jgi:hypothetical protein
MSWAITTIFLQKSSIRKISGIPWIQDLIWALELRQLQIQLKELTKDMLPQCVLEPCPAVTVPIKSAKKNRKVAISSACPKLLK